MAFRLSASPLRPARMVIGKLVARRAVNPSVAPENIPRYEAGRGGDLRLTSRSLSEADELALAEARGIRSIAIFSTCASPLKPKTPSSRPPWPSLPHGEACPGSRRFATLYLTSPHSVDPPGGRCYRLPPDGRRTLAADRVTRALARRASRCRPRGPVRRHGRTQCPWPEVGAAHRARSG